MEETKNNVVNNEVQENIEVEAKEVKTFTQDEVDKMISKRLQRERKDIEAKIEAERKEAEELAKLSEQEKQKKLFEKQVREFEETKKAFEAERLYLPIEFAEMLKGEDAESTFNNINVFEAKFNEALEKMVTERLRGSVPKVATVSGGITKEDFKKMSLAQQAELAKKDKDLYLELSKN